MSKVYPFINHSDNNKIIIKEANLLNVHSIYKCNKKCLPAYYNLIDYLDFVKDKNHIVLILLKNDSVIGYIIGKFYSLYNRVHIVSFAIYKEYRGKGLGYNLMKSINDISLKRFKNVKTLSLYTSINNTIACKFYYKFGFKVHKIIKNYYENNENAYYFIKNIE